MQHAEANDNRLDVVLGDYAIMACVALDAADELTCGVLRHEAGRQLLWQDALFSPLA